MKFFSNFKLLIVLMVLGMLLATAVAFMLFERAEVTRAVLASGDESALNVLRVVNLNIASQYKDLEAFRQYATDRHQQQLRNLTGVVVSHIDTYHKLYEQGAMTEPEARRRALETVQDFRYGHDDYFIIYDTNHCAVSHPDPNVRGRNMSATLDSRGRPILATMESEIFQTGEWSCTIAWPRRGETNPVPKLLYFQPYTNWGWYVGTGVYIDDIDADAARRMGEIMEVLKTTFSQVKVAETGYFFLFDEYGRFLIHPSMTSIDTAMAGSLFTNFVRAAENPGVPYQYQWDKPGDLGRHVYTKYAHVEKFEPLDWYLASSVYKDEMEKPARRIIKRQARYVGVIVLFGMLGAYFLVSRLTRPLARLTHHADRLQASDFAMPEDEAKDILAITFPDEVSRLAATMSSMEQRLKEYLKNLKETIAARERMQSELRIAHEIQMNMLPRHAAEIEARREIDLVAELVPARDVGGDLYDYFFVDDDRLALVVGDVSDKGVPASLFMSRSIALLRHIAIKESVEPDAIFKMVNRDLLQGNDLCMFLTAWMGILDTRTGELVYTNAGHLPPFVMPVIGGCRLLDLPPGPPLGVIEEADYQARRVRLAVGDGLVVFTDGVTEATDRNVQLYGYARLEALLSRCRACDAAARIVQTIMHGVKDFVQDMPQSDDIAILCVRRTSSEA
ncbi:MAG TPA: cache domain-containing protein [Kiritimatiellia bacterium]|nr:cache domain-containing protein [Kiritimatiellia bacterium]HRZ11630.1 cache domain-containing protein [Kiritimatiellia bacterium]HSA16819.1 cache domain-containing protein [Kiritimatiellia bacterium]